MAIRGDSAASSFDTDYLAKYLRLQHLRVWCPGSISLDQQERFSTVPARTHDPMDDDPFERRTVQDHVANGYRGMPDRPYVQNVAVPY
jgi:hypothetical protein